jgi:hypothetical protein
MALAQIDARQCDSFDKLGCEAARPHYLTNIDVIWLRPSSVVRTNDV